LYIFYKTPKSLVILIWETIVNDFIFPNSSFFVAVYAFIKIYMGETAEYALKPTEIRKEKKRKEKKVKSNRSAQEVAQIQQTTT
jgi:hypothetical protein